MRPPTSEPTNADRGFSLVLGGSTLSTNADNSNMSMVEECTWCVCGRREADNAKFVSRPLDVILHEFNIGCEHDWQMLSMKDICDWEMPDRVSKSRMIELAKGDGNFKLAFEEVYGGDPPVCKSLEAILKQNQTPRPLMSLSSNGKWRVHCKVGLLTFGKSSQVAQLARTNRRASSDSNRLKFKYLDQKNFGEVIITVSGDIYRRAEDGSYSQSGKLEESELRKIIEASDIRSAHYVSKLGSFTPLLNSEVERLCTEILLDLSQTIILLSKNPELQIPCEGILCGLRGVETNLEATINYLVASPFNLKIQSPAQRCVKLRQLQMATSKQLQIAIAAQIREDYVVLEDPQSRELNYRDPNYRKHVVSRENALNEFARNINDFWRHIWIQVLPPSIKNTDEAWRTSIRAIFEDLDQEAS